MVVFTSNDVNYKAHWLCFDKSWECALVNSKANSKTQNEEFVALELKVLLRSSTGIQTYTVILWQFFIFGWGEIADLY